MSAMVQSFVFSFFLGVFFLVGCSDATTPEPTTKDEISAYLDEHPELKEKKVYEDHGSPVRP